MLPWSWVLWFSTLLVGPCVWDCSFSVRDSSPGSPVGMQKCYPVSTCHANCHTNRYIIILLRLSFCGSVCGCDCGCVRDGVFVIVGLWLCACGGCWSETAHRHLELAVGQEGRQASRQEGKQAGRQARRKEGRNKGLQDTKLSALFFNCSCPISSFYELPGRTIVITPIRPQPMPT